MPAASDPIPRLADHYDSAAALVAAFDELLAHAPWRNNDDQMAEAVRRMVPECLQGKATALAWDATTAWEWLVWGHCSSRPWPPCPCSSAADLHTLVEFQRRLYRELLGKNMAHRWHRPGLLPGEFEEATFQWLFQLAEPLLRGGWLQDRDWPPHRPAQWGAILDSLRPVADVQIITPAEACGYMVGLIWEQMRLIPGEGRPPQPERPRSQLELDRAFDAVILWCEEQSQQVPALGDDALPPFMAASDLAKRLGKSEDAVGSFLARYRADHPDCYTPTESPRRNEPRYLYRTADVLLPLRQHFDLTDD